MSYTNEVEREITAGIQYSDLFKGVNLRRTEICVCVWTIQALCGSSFTGYSTYFYEQAGLPTSFAFDLSIIQYGLSFFGTIFSWVFMTYFGRRTLYLLGLSLMFVWLMLIGFLSLGVGKNPSFSWAIGSVLLVFVMTFNFSVGPACYSLVSEMSATRVRTKSTSFARLIYNIQLIINGVFMPYMLNTTAWNWGAKTGFFWAGMCLLCLTWTFFRLPEPKGRTFVELDILFEKKIPTRKFASTVIDPFETHPVIGVKKEILNDA